MEKMMDENNVTYINKEDIPNFHFVSYDVLDNEAQRSARKSDLERAMLLGNASHVKIGFVFLTTEGLKKVETTVWAATDDAIVLKGGVSIPMHCIKEIKL